MIYNDEKEMTIDKGSSLSASSLLLDHNQTLLLPEIDADAMALLGVNEDDEGTVRKAGEQGEVEKMNEKLDIKKSPSLRSNVTGKTVRGSWSLCSIPEDRNMAPALFLVPRRRRMRRYDDDEDSAYEDDEPIFHRSPVSLENGYRPSSAVYELRFLQDPSDVNDDEEEYSETSSEDDSSEASLENFPAKNIELREARVPLFLRLFLKLLQLMALWLVVSMCLVSISFTVLLTLHHLR
jgi:hypothetical protein